MENRLSSVPFSTPPPHISILIIKAVEYRGTTIVSAYEYIPTAKKSSFYNINILRV